MAARTGSRKATKSELEKELAQALAANRRLQAELDRQDTAADARKGKRLASKTSSRMPKGLHDKMVERAIRREAEGKETRKEKGILTGRQNRMLADAIRKHVVRMDLVGQVAVSVEQPAWREACRAYLDGAALNQAARMYINGYDRKLAQKSRKSRGR